MIKRHKTKLILSSLVILLPAVLGLIFWNKLPYSMASHWGFTGEADAFSSKSFSVIAVPLIMLAVHWLTFLLTFIDRRNRNQTERAIGLVVWIIPVLTLFISATSLCITLGYTPKLSLSMAVMALLLVVIGNSLPKCRRNSTIGIKCRWTLMSDENWNATHRFSGKVWVAGGLILLLCCMLPEKIFTAVLIAVISISAVAPVLYSWIYYRRQLAAGTAPAAAPVKTKQELIVTAVILSLVAVFVLPLLFTGKLNYVYSDEGFKVEASFWADLSLRYDEIDSAEYIDDANPGTRVSGFASSRLLMGSFKNDEYGLYTRYSSPKSDSAIVLDCGGRSLVISGMSTDETLAIFEYISSRLE